MNQLVSDDGRTGPPELASVDRHAAEFEVRAALELMPQLVWTTTPDGYHDYYNQRWYDFTGMPRPGDPDASEEGWNWKTYLHPDDFDRTVALWSDCLATGKPYQIEYRFKEKRTGNYRWFLGRALPQRDSSGRVRRWFGTCTDVDDDKRVRERLIESEDRFRNSMHHSAIGHALAALDGRLMEVNAALARIVGYTGDELVGMRLHDITHPEDMELHVIHRDRLIAGAVESFTYDKRFRHRTGRPVWVQLNVSMVRSAAGTPLYLVIQVQDLTERRALEAQLREAHKLEAVGRLAGGVGHDFNNLLGAILGYTEVLLANAPEPHVRADLEGIRTAAERGARLTAQLLTFGQRHLRRPTLVDLGAAVLDAETLIRRFAGAHIQVVTEAERESCVRADPGEVDQILISLVVNASEAMPAGGRLGVNVKTVELPDPVVAGGLPAGRYVRLVVTDTGTGISADVLPRIFEPFFTTKGQASTGLGLATVHGIVAQLGGAIEVDSTPGVGTRVTVLLPCFVAGEDEGAGQVAGGSPAARAAPAEVLKRTVLLVEDEPALRDVFTRVLTRAGHSVITASNGREALALWADHGERVSVLVTDLVMPHLGGRETAAEIQRLRPGLPVLFLSGYTDDEIMRRALDDPTIAFLTKPFPVAALVAAVERSLAGDPA